MPGVTRVNLLSANEHIPDIKRRLQLVKKRSRATRNSLPFSRIPKLMTINEIINIGKMLN